MEKKALSLTAARKMVAAAEAEAERNNWRGVVAVVDDGGWIILLERMDHRGLTAGVELAPGKARVAALYKKPSQALEDAINHGRYAAITARGFIEMQGALPVVVDGEVIGAIGASFATPEEDEQVAKAGLAGLGSEPRLIAIIMIPKFAIFISHTPGDFGTDGRTAAGRGGADD